MAPSAPVSLSALEGDFSVLRRCGLPLPICFHLQDQGLDLSSAVWTAKQSKTGFSMSLFWKCDVNLTKEKRKKKRKRRKKKTSLDSPMPTMQTESAKEDGTAEPEKTPLLTPTKAHQDDVSVSAVDATTAAAAAAGTDKTTDSAVALSSCRDVTYEARDGKPGVSYDDGGWTPVVRKKSRRKVARTRGGAESLGDSSSDCEIFIPEGAEVEYVDGEGTPSLSVRTRKTRQWIPIEAKKPPGATARLRPKSQRPNYKV